MSLDLKKGSYNRLWAVLAALAYKNGKATLKQLSDLSGLPRSSTEDVLKKVLDAQVPELVIERENATFIVVEWGEFISRKQLSEFYTKHLNNG
ncbi:MULTISPECIES: helix-turn-helix domain-containing protein [Vibrio]|uniref:helix-turn-helix domain-containing protein n=1 Tax=Vibrio TaxID=662 RepID=UPI00187E4EA7|nr:helix-turn-helix domain-containing protein [Vibrio sp. OPT46]EJE4208786.1 helix-turn-helix domain-containing protein [Vibrio parahaemolyticus]MBE8572414.1 helix-turn-helix domain-containing protein [Vibrio sp. OPT46]